MKSSFTKITSSLAAALISFSVVAGGEYEDDREREDSNTFSFAMIGDVPYGVAPYTEYPPFDNLVKKINRQKKLKWVIHTGDIKSGGTECSNELFYDRLDRYNAFNKPFIYTPGDNEWTDCHRVNAGEYQPLERLAMLREVFFFNPGETIGGKTMSVETQAWTDGYEEFPENVRWSKNGVIFAALHVVGSNNGLKAFDPSSSATRTDEDDAEAVRRIDAAVEWINSTFDKAVEEKAPGVLFMMQANPILEVSYALPSGDALTAARLGFTEILTTLEQRTLDYGKPVVLAHGDSHFFRVDKPGLVENGFIGNFTRVENFGSSRVHWVKITVNPKSKGVFNFKPMIIEENL
ncbi:MAG: metallophosphoesterase [Candidatus Thiodiazotropha sp. LLP2]